MKIKFLPILRCDDIDGMGSKCTYYAGESYCGRIKMHVCAHNDGSLHHSALNVPDLFADCPLSNMEVEEE